MLVLQKQFILRVITGIFVIVFVFYPLPFGLYPVRATEFTSPSFKILDPVIDTGGTANSTSSSFQQLGSIGEISVGRSTSSSFELRAGFLFFPAPSGEVATPVDTSISVSGSGGIIPPGILRRLLRRPFCADINGDGLVGLTDVSVMFFAWHPAERALAGLILKDHRPDCNDDNLVDIVDLSIVLFWWDES